MEGGRGAGVVGVVVPVQPGEGAAPAAAVAGLFRGTRVALVYILSSFRLTSPNPHIPPSSISNHQPHH